jgi:Ni,Fe-hydrogenase III small subunit
MLLVTGPVSVNMEEALKLTYDAVPDPKLVVAVGDCGACGGVFGESYACRGAVANIIPVNHTVAGCPPNPAAILDAILKAVRSVAIPS